MKRGFIVGLIALIFSISFVSAYDYNGNFGLPSISSLAQNEWFNAALLFILIFAFCWFILQQVFSTSKGAAFVASLVLGIIGSFGVIYFYGPIIARFGVWLLLAIVAAIILLLYFQFRDRGISILIILLVLSLAWLFYGRMQLCPPNGIFPNEVCIIIDTIAAIIAIVAVVRFFIWLIGRMARGHGGGERGFRQPRGPREPRGPRQPGFIRRWWRRRAEARAERERLHHELIDRNRAYSRMINEARRRNRPNLVAQLERRRDRELGQIRAQERQAAQQEQRAVHQEQAAQRATPNVQWGGQPQTQPQRANFEKLRQHYQQLYSQKNQQKRALQSQMQREVNINVINNYIRQRNSLERELNKFRNNAVMRGGIQLQLRQVNEKLNRSKIKFDAYKQKLRTLDSEINELANKIQRMK